MACGSSDLNRFNALVSEIDAIYHLFAQQMGVSDSVQHILYVLCAQGEGCTQADICRVGAMSKQTIHSAIRGMERDGLLILTEGVGRSRAIFLTDAGRRLMERVAHPLIEAENSIFAGWTAAERESYLRLTRRYVDEFRARLKGQMEEVSDEES